MNMLAGYQPSTYSGGALPMGWSPIMSPARHGMSMQSPSTGHAGSGKDSVGVFYNALRALGLVMLLLIVLSIVYAGWIAAVNWGDINV